MVNLGAQAYRHMKSPHGIAPLDFDSQTFAGVCGKEGHGPFYVVSVQFIDGVARRSAFRTISCPWAIAIGSAVTSLVENSSSVEALALSAVDVASQLGEIPHPKQAYVSIALAALRSAIAKYEGSK